MDTAVAVTAVTAGTSGMIDARRTEMRALWAACEDTAAHETRAWHALAELQPQAAQLRAQLGTAVEYASMNRAATGENAALAAQLRDRAERAAEDIRATMRAEVDRLQERHERALVALRSDGDRALREANDRFEQELTAHTETNAKVQSARHERRVAELTEEHTTQMDRLQASEAAMAAAHDEAVHVLRTESQAALNTVQMEHSEAMDGAEQAVAQLQQLRAAHDSLHTQKSALYEVIDHMHESAAESDAEQVSMEETHRAAMGALVAEHAEATEQAAMRVRQLEEERESQLAALKSEHETVLSDLHANTEAAIETMAMKLDGQSQTGPESEASLVSQHEVAMSVLRSESDEALAGLRAEYQKQAGESAAAVAALEQSQRSALAGWVARQAVTRAELYEKNAGECERLRSLVSAIETEMASLKASESAAAEARARDESDHQLAIAEVVARETELRSALAAAEAEAEMMQHTNTASIGSVASLQDELAAAQTAGAAASSGYARRVAELTEEHTTQMDRLQASEAAMAAAHDEAVHVLRTESQAALDTVQMEHSEAMDGAEQAVAQLQQLRAAHDSLHTQKSALYEVIDHMHESAAESDAEQVSMEETHRAAMGALVAEHAEATEQAAMRVRQLEEERESQLAALKSEHETVLSDLHANTEAAIETMAMKLDGESQTGPESEASLVSQHEVAMSVLRSESDEALAGLRAEYQKQAGESAAAVAALEQSQRSALAGWVARQAVTRAELYEKNAGECERLRSLVSAIETEMASLKASESAAAEARARDESDHQLAIAEVVARETELRSALAAAEAEAEMMQHTNTASIGSVASLQDELAAAQTAGAAASSGYARRVAELTEEHTTQMDRLQASEAAMAAAHDEAVHVLRTESQAALDTVQMEHSEAMDGAEQAVAQLQQLRAAHDSLHTQKSALYEVIDHMHESAAESDAEQVSMEETHRAAMGALVAEHAEATEQAAMRVRQLEEERESQLAALKSEHETVLSDLHANTEAAIETMAMKLDGQSQTGQDLLVQVAALKSEHEESAAAVAALEQSQRSALAGWVARQAVTRAELYEKNAGECERLRSLVSAIETEMASLKASESAAAEARARDESDHQLAIAEVVARETELRSALAAAEAEAEMMQHTNTASIGSVASLQDELAAAQTAGAAASSGYARRVAELTEEHTTQMDRLQASEAAMAAAHDEAVHVLRTESQAALDTVQMEHSEAMDGAEQAVAQLQQLRAAHDSLHTQKSALYEVIDHMHESAAESDAEQVSMEETHRAAMGALVAEHAEATEQAAMRVRQLEEERESQLAALKSEHETVLSDLHANTEAAIETMAMKLDGQSQTGQDLLVQVAALKSEHEESAAAVAALEQSQRSALAGWVARQAVTRAELYEKNAGECERLRSLVSAIETEMASLKASESAAAEARARDESDHQLAIAEVVARETELRSALAAAEAEAEMMQHTNTASIGSVASLQDELAAAQTAGAAASSGYARRVAELTEEHTTQMDRLQASEAAMAAAHDEAVHVLRTESQAALDTVQMEHSEAMDGAEQAVAQLQQLRAAHDSLHTQKSALYEVIDHMHESAAESDAEQVSMEETHRAAMGALVAEHAEATEQAAMRVRQLEEERESQLAALKSEHETVLSDLHANTEAAIETMAMKLDGQSQTGQDLLVQVAALKSEHEESAAAVAALEQSQRSALAGWVARQAVTRAELYEKNAGECERLRSLVSAIETEMASLKASESAAAEARARDESDHQLAIAEVVARETELRSALAAAEAEAEMMQHTNTASIGSVASLQDELAAAQTAGAAASSGYARRVAELTEEHTTQMDRLQASEAAMAAAHDEAVHVLRTESQAALDTVQMEHSEAMDGAEQAVAQLQQLRAAHDSLHTQKSALYEVIDHMHESAAESDAEQVSMEETHRAAMGALVAEHAEATEQAAMRVRQLEEERESQLAALKSEHETALCTAQNDHDASVSELRSESEIAHRSAQARFKQAVRKQVERTADLRSEYEEEHASTKMACDDKVCRIELQCKVALDEAIGRERELQLRWAQAEADVKQMDCSAREADECHRAAMGALVVEHAEATEQAAMRVRQLEKERESQLAALKSEHEESAAAVAALEQSQRSALAGWVARQAVTRAELYEKNAGECERLRSLVSAIETEMASLVWELEVSESAAAEARARDESDHQLAIVEVVARETELRSALVAAEAEAEMMQHTNTASIGSVASLQDELAAAQTAGAAASSGYARRVAELTEEHTTQMDRLQASEAAMAAAHDEAVHVLRTESQAALDTVQMEHSEAMDGAEQAVAQLQQLRAAHDSLHTQKSALYEVIDHMHESAAESDAEQVSMEETHRAAMGALVAEHAEATEQAAMRVRQLEEERESQLAALKSEHETALCTARNDHDASVSELRSESEIAHRSAQARFKQAVRKQVECTADLRSEYEDRIQISAAECDRLGSEMATIEATHRSAIASRVVGQALRCAELEDHLNAKHSEQVCAFQHQVQLLNADRAQLAHELQSRSMPHSITPAREDKTSERVVAAPTYALDTAPLSVDGSLSIAGALGALRAKDKFKEHTEWLHWAMQDDNSDEDGDVQPMGAESKSTPTLAEFMQARSTLQNIVSPSSGRKRSPTKQPGRQDEVPTKLFQSPVTYRQETARATATNRYDGPQTVADEMNQQLVALQAELAQVQDHAEAQRKQYEQELAEVAAQHFEENEKTRLAVRAAWLETLADLKARHEATISSLQEKRDGQVVISLSSDELVSNHKQTLAALQSEHQAAMESAQKELQECARREAQLQDEHAKAELRALEEAAESESALVSEYESMLSSLRSQHESAQQSAHDRYKQELHDCVKREADLQSELSAVQSQLRHVQGSKLTSEQHVEREIRTVQRQAEQERFDLIAHYEKVQTHMELALQNHKSDHALTVSEHKQTLAALQSEHQAAMESAQKELQECARREAQLQDEHAKAELKALEEAAESESALVSEYESMLSSLRSQHESAQQSAHEHHEQVVAKQVELTTEAREQYEAHVESSTAECERLQAGLASAAKKHAECLDECAQRESDLRSELAGLRVELELLQHVNCTSDQSAQILQQEIAQLAEAMELQRNEFEHDRAQLVDQHRTDVSRQVDAAKKAEASEAAAVHALDLQSALTKVQHEHDLMVSTLVAEHDECSHAATESCKAQVQAAQDLCTLHVSTIIADHDRIEKIATELATQSTDLKSALNDTKAYIGQREIECEEQIAQGKAEVVTLQQQVAAQREDMLAENAVAAERACTALRALQSELDIERQSTQKSLDSLESEHETALLAARDEHDTAMRELQTEREAAHQSAQERFKQAVRKQVERTAELRQEYEDRIESSSAECDRLGSEITSMQSKLSAQSAEHEAYTATAATSHSEQVAELQATHASEICELRESELEQMAELESDRAASLEELTAAHATATRNIRAESEAAEASAVERANELRARLSSMEDDLEMMQYGSDASSESARILESEIIALRQQAAAQREDMLAENAVAAERACTALRALQSELDVERQSTQKSLDSLESEHETALLAARDEHDTAMRELQTEREAAHQSAQERFKQAVRKQVERTAELRQEYEDRIESSSAECDRLGSEITSMQSKLSAQSAEHEAYTATAATSHSEQVAELQATHASEICELRESELEQMAELESDRAASLEAVAKALGCLRARDSDLFSIEDAEVQLDTYHADAGEHTLVQLHSQMLEAAKANALQCDALKSEMMDMDVQHKAEVSSLAKEHEAALSSANAQLRVCEASEADSQSLLGDYESTVTSLRTQHLEALRMAQDDSEAALRKQAERTAELRQEYEDRIESSSAECDRLGSEITSMQSKLSAQSAEHEAYTATAATSHSEQVAELQATHASEICELRESELEQMAELESDRAASLEELTAAHTAAIAQAGDDHQTVSSALAACEAEVEMMQYNATASEDSVAVLHARTLHLQRVASNHEQAAANAEACHQVMLADLANEHKENNESQVAEHASAMRLLQTEHELELQKAKERFKAATASQVERAQQLEKHYETLTGEQEASALRAGELHQRVVAKLQMQSDEAMESAQKELQECARREAQLQDEHAKAELKALEEAAESESALVSEYESMLSSLRSQHESAQQSAHEHHEQVVAKQVELTTEAREQYEAHVESSTAECERLQAGLASAAKKHAECLDECAQRESDLRSELAGLRVEFDVSLDTARVETALKLREAQREAEIASAAKAAANATHAAATAKLWADYEATSSELVAREAELERARQLLGHDESSVEACTSFDPRASPMSVDDDSIIGGTYGSDDLDESQSRLWTVSPQTTPCEDDLIVPETSDPQAEEEFQVANAVVSETALTSPGVREAQRTAGARRISQQAAAADAKERRQERKRKKNASQTQRAQVADALRKVYSIHAPAKVSRVDALLEKYAPSEWQRLLWLVRSKYE